MTLPRLASTLLVCTLISPVLAQDPSTLPAARSEPETQGPLTGEWFGARPWIESHGLVFEASYLIDWSKNFRGGVNTNGSNFGRLFDASLTLDTKQAGLWPDGTLFADFICEGGDFASADVGDLQVVDNADADGRVELYELWYQHTFLDGAIRIKVGKIDANVDFDAAGFAGDFINSSPGFSPTILGFPTYADPSTAALLFIEPVKSIYLGFGVFDGASQEGFNTGLRGPSTFLGAPADLFLIAEGGFRWELGADPRPGRAAIGLWRQTGTFDRIDGGTDNGSCGAYALADQCLWKDGDRELGMFFQYGWADPNVSIFEHHIGIGVAMAGPIAERPADALGLMISTVLLSNKAGFDDDFESAIELYYKCQVTSWLSIQPDLQYVINPGGVTENDDALALIIRFVADL